MRIDEEKLEEMFAQVHKRMDEEHKYNEKRFDQVDKKVDGDHAIKTALDGDTLLDNQEVMTMLRISLRTLARYRAQGLLPYTRGESDGKCQYRGSDVTKFMAIRGINPNKKTKSKKIKKK